MAGLVYFSIVALAALVFFALGVAIVRRHPPVGIGLVGLILVTIWELPDLPPIIVVSGLSVYPADAVTLLLLVVAVLEASQLKENMRGWLVPWMFFGALIAASLLRGVAAFGLGIAVNESRMVVYFFLAMTWALAVRPDRLKLRTVSLVLGWALVLVAAYHGVVYGVHGAVSAVSIDGDLVQTGRVLVGPQAMALLLCAGTVFLSPSSTARVRRQFDALSSVAFLGIVVIAQHRSVWAAGALGMITVLIWSGRREARNRVVVFLVAGAWLGLVGWISGILDSLGSGLFESASDLRTYAWRTSSWQYLIADAVAKGPEAVFVGEPFGTGYLRQIYTGTWATNSAHNWYVTVFVRFGILGLTTLTGMLMAAFVKSRSRPALCTFVLVAVATYGWAYQFDWFLAPWLGAALTVSLGDSRGKLVRVDHAGVDRPGSMSLTTAGSMK
jgi:hypothetical protein